MNIKCRAISVIVPHLNQPGALKTCLASLEAQSIPRDSFEIIVVDNGSATLPTGVLAQYPGVRLLCEARPGPGPARNTGVAAASGEVLAFIDADCRAHPDWLSSVWRSLHSLPPRTVLGGDVRIWRGTKPHQDAIAAYESVFAYRFKLYIERDGYCGTGNMAMLRRDFHCVGPFAGIDVAEDMEWGQRAQRAGLRFQYIPEMIVFHPARSSLQELYVKWDRQLLHYRNMADGKPAWRLRWIAQALLVLASPAPGIITILTSDRLYGIGARIKAIAVMCAVRMHRVTTMLSLLRNRRAVIWNR
ncbi:glycosyltransferase [Bradyrhizobium sp. 182]|uniref:glycosyltransferase n=1 Tax=unclassified Bradyrhizobium TaxID=2631580 RepID=UPI001FFBBFDB|nr:MULTISPECIES: glycosyltransferase [unclassified Bradyrhizobium]MCK1424849.1 glycosyltransferase [Bradyrhizobium sp. CW12]MCK1531879.1 glycosyltransferase [Bradyrhizobium sp. 182]MCK1646530.1 glycosyltransferase [Bradyrhizobium sp. 154]